MTPSKGQASVTKAKVWPCTGMWGGVSCGTESPSSPAGLLTEVEVAALVLGLEEAPSRLGVHVGSLGHQELHIVLAAALDGDVQGGLTWKGTARSPGPSSRRAGTRAALEGVGCTVWKWAGGGVLQARAVAGCQEPPDRYSQMRHL